MLDRHVIANMALGRLGANRISSFDDGSTEAVLIRENYDQCVRECIGDHPWSFAIAQATLGQDATPAALDFDYSYTRPTDCIAPRWLMEPCGQDAFGRTKYRRSLCAYRIQGSKVCTNLAGAGLAYIRRAPESDFDPLFASAVMHLLTSRMAMALTEVEGKGKAEFDLFMIQIARARSKDSQKDTPDAFDTGGLINWHAG